MSENSNLAFEDHEHPTLPSDSRMILRNWFNGGSNVTSISLVSSNIISDAIYKLRQLKCDPMDISNIEIALGKIILGCDTQVHLELVQMRLMAIGRSFDLTRHVGNPFILHCVSIEKVIAFIRIDSCGRVNK